MATKAWIARQRRREALVQRKWDQRQALKAEILDPNKSIEEKLVAVDKLNKMKKNASTVRLRNRCQFTGRSRGVLRKFKMSRICFRDMANQGLIPGVFKASW